MGQDRHYLGHMEQRETWRGYTIGNYFITRILDLSLPPVLLSGAVCWTQAREDKKC